MKRPILFVVLIAAILGATVLVRPRLETFWQQSARETRPKLSGPMALGESAARPVRPVYTFRGGATRAGEIAKLPGPVRGLRSVWRRTPLNFDLHGAAKATPAVDATGVYVGDDTGHFQKFDHEGHRLWTFFVHTLERGIHATAVVTGDTVYFGAYDGWFYALDKTTGRPRWTIALGKVIGSSAIVWKDALFVTVETESNGFVAKLDPVDGRVIWTSEYLGEQAHSSVTIDEDDGLAILGSNAANVTAIDLETGARAWTFPTPKQNKGTGALVRGLYVFGGTDGNVFALYAATGQPAWVSSVGGRILGNVTIDEAHGLGIISSANGLTAFDVASGQRRWQREYDGPKSTRGTGGQTAVMIEVGAKKQVLAQCARRRFCVMNAQSGDVVSRFTVSGEFSGSPTLDGRRLYLAYVDQGLEAFEIQF